MSGVFGGFITLAPAAAQKSLDLATKCQHLALAQSNAAWSWYWASEFVIYAISTKSIAFATCQKFPQFHKQSSRCVSRKAGKVEVYGLVCCLSRPEQGILPVAGMFVLLGISSAYHYVRLTMIHFAFGVSHSRVFMKGSKRRRKAGARSSPSLTTYLRTPFYPDRSLSPSTLYHLLGLASPFSRLYPSLLSWATRNSLKSRRPGPPRVVAR